jgi:hypothetical protein
MEPEAVVQVTGKKINAKEAVILEVVGEHFDGLYS